MNKLKIVLLNVVFIALPACQTPELLLTPQFKTSAHAYEVKGRQGWMLNQVLSFGSYYTSEVKRGWTKSYDIPFIVRFQGSSEKFSFTQFTGDSLKAHVFCLGKIRTTEYEIVKDIFAIPLKSENTFAGSIVCNDKLIWNFILYNPDAGYGKNEYSTLGFLKNNLGQVISIKPVKRLEDHKGLKSIDNYGFEFFQEEIPIAAVSVLNNGKVWMSDSLSAQQDLVISAICSAILLKSSLGQEFKSDYTQ